MNHPSLPPAASFSFPGATPSPCFSTPTGTHADAQAPRLALNGNSVPPAPSVQLPLPTGCSIRPESRGSNTFLFTAPSNQTPLFRFAGYENHGWGASPTISGGVWLRANEDGADGHWISLERVREQSTAECSVYRVRVKDAYAGTDYSGRLIIRLGEKEYSIRPEEVRDPSPRQPAPPRPTPTPLPKAPDGSLAATPKGNHPPDGSAAVPKSAPALDPPVVLPSPSAGATKEKTQPTPAPTPVVPPTVPIPAPLAVQPADNLFVRLGFFSSAAVPSATPVSAGLNTQINAFLKSMKGKIGRWDQLPDGHHQVRAEFLDENRFLITVRDRVENEAAERHEVMLFSSTPPESPTTPRSWNLIQASRTDGDWQPATAEKQAISASDTGIVAVRFQRYLLNQGRFPFSRDPFSERGYYSSANEPAVHPASPELNAKINSFFSARPGLDGLYSTPYDGFHTISVEVIDDRHFLLMEKTLPQNGRSTEWVATLCTRRREEGCWDISRVRYVPGKDWQSDTENTGEQVSGGNGLVGTQFDRYLPNPKYPLNKDHFAAAGYYHAGTEANWTNVTNIDGTCLDRQLRSYPKVGGALELEVPAGNRLTFHRLNENCVVYTASGGSPETREAALFYRTSDDRWTTARVRFASGTWRYLPRTLGPDGKPLPTALESLFEQIWVAPPKKIEFR